MNNAKMVELRLGDIVRLRKEHACGGDVWQIQRLGADIGVKCQTCNRYVLLARPTCERRIKEFITRGPLLQSDKKE